MVRYFAHSFSLVLAVSGVLANVAEGGQNSTVPPEAANPVEEAIRSLEVASAAALQAEDRGLPQQQVIQLMEKMIKPAEDLNSLLEEPNNAYKFIEAKGVERVIMNHLPMYHTGFRSLILNLLKQLFIISPNIISRVIPVELLDKLLDLFENDENMIVKALVIDILYEMLPENPRLQARVMKRKGLDPFYDQVHKLDNTIIETKLKLFGKIVKEHLRMHENKDNLQKNKSDSIKYNIYKRIGLIERIATERVCVGLLNIFYALTRTKEKYYSVPVLDLLTVIEPYCSAHYLRETKAAHYFRDLQKHVNEMDKKTKLHYKNKGLNVTQVKDAVEKYVNVLLEMHEEL